MEGGDFEYLVKNYFPKMPLQQKLQIKSDGRPKPKQVLRTERKKWFRTFSEESFSWLAASW